MNQHLGIIGDAFPEIDDKLLNTIQLSNMEQTDVLLESISQRSSEFNPFSFENVINLKDNIKYVKFALAPLIVLAPFYLFGKQEGIESSFKRVIDYNTAYQEPPPFIFSLKNKSMEVIEGKPFNLEVLVSGRPYTRGCSDSLQKRAVLLKQEREKFIFF
jgi:hypothetical protein